MWHTVKWSVAGALGAIWVGVLVAHANVQPPQEPAQVEDACECAPPVPGEVQKLRTEVRLLKAAARVNSGIHTRTLKQVEAFKACLELVDPSKQADCRALLR